MRRKLSIQRNAVQEALDYCTKHGGGDERAAASASLLALLLQKETWGVADLEKEAGCGRTHLFDVLAWVRTKQFDRLVGGGKFPASLLDDARREELRTKLGTEFHCAQDVAAWYKKWSGNPVPLPTVYGWCQALGLPIRSLPKPLKQPAARKGGSKKNSILSLGPEAVAELRERQKQERIAYSIPEDKFESPYPQNPVRIIEGILRCATTKDSMRQIARDLHVGWTDIRRWIRRYGKGDIDKLCKVVRGKRPSGKHIG